MSGDQYNVTSYNQQGGITAGQVNFGRPPRHLEEGLRAQLRGLLSKDRKIEVHAALGHAESFQFATEVKDFLIAEGYEVDGVNQTLSVPSITGQRHVRGDHADQLRIGPQE